jgi:hypothetical protein
MLALRCAALFFGIGLLLPGFGQTKGRVAEYPTAKIREEQQVTVNGVIETWELEWKAAPRPECEPNEISLTCPCTGFAYGEAGDLDVVRLRGGIEIERLRLTPFFSDFDGEAIVQRWQADYKNDFKNSEREDFPIVVSRRPTVQLMYFSDYDHDGWETEFYLQTKALPCGKSYGIVIGLSKRDPRLHVFGTASNPIKPLPMQKREWEALRNASAPIEGWIGPAETTALSRKPHCYCGGRPRASLVVDVSMPVLVALRVESRFWRTRCDAIRVAFESMEKADWTRARFGVGANRTRNVGLG